MKAEVFSQLHKARVLVVGDVMLDRYWYGDKLRVSDEAPVLIEELVANGATVTAYDPAAMPAAKRLLAALPGVRYADSPLAALEGADALAVVTEWQEFRSPDFEAIRTRLKTPAIFDGRNLYDPALLKRLGLEYYPIGRAAVKAGP